MFRGQLFQWKINLQERWSLNQPPEAKGLWKEEFLACSRLSEAMGLAKKAAWEPEPAFGPSLA